jgi:hypothetical protein
VVSLLGGEAAYEFGDDVYLVDLIVTREHGLAVNELADDAADCPEVCRFAVGLADEQLGAAVPAGGYIVCEIVLLVWQEAGESEVADF